jgi:hypothetical protein
MNVDYFYLCLPLSIEFRLTDENMSNFKSFFENDYECYRTEKVQQTRLLPDLKEKIIEFEQTYYWVNEDLLAKELTPLFIDIATEWQSKYENTGYNSPWFGNENKEHLKSFIDTLYETDIKKLGDRVELLDLIITKDNFFMNYGNVDKVFKYQNKNQYVLDFNYFCISLLNTTEDFDIVLSDAEEILFQFVDYFKEKYSSKYKLAKYLFVNLGDT